MGRARDTALQINLGESRAAARRLVARILTRGDEPESSAGVVQAVRVCGLLTGSLAAHERATALDDVSRATSLLRERLAAGHLSARMAGLMMSVLTALEGRRGETVATIKQFAFERDPELLVYLARHCAMAGLRSGEAAR
jgi:hypothetical protein